MAGKNLCPLVLVEWEDSAQPAPAWRHLDANEKHEIVRCVSVGWLIADGPVKALAPNMGDIHSETNVQASGVIRIPARCVTRLVRRLQRGYRGDGR